jgi:hypothetical protein
MVPDLSALRYYKYKIMYDMQLPIRWYLVFLLYASDNDRVTGRLFETPHRKAVLNHWYDLLQYAQVGAEDVSTMQLDVTFVAACTSAGVRDTAELCKHAMVNLYRMLETTGKLRLPSLYDPIASLPVSELLTSNLRDFKRWGSFFEKSSGTDSIILLTYNPLIIESFSNDVVIYPTPAMNWSSFIHMKHARFFVVSFDDYKQDAINSLDQIKIDKEGRISSYQPGSLPLFQGISPICSLAIESIQRNFRFHTANFKLHLLRRGRITVPHGLMDYMWNVVIPMIKVGEVKLYCYRQSVGDRTIFMCRDSLLKVVGWKLTVYSFDNKIMSYIMQEYN